MQTILVVPRCVASLNDENDKNDFKNKLAHGSTEFHEAQWDHVKKATPMYTSQIDWKQVQVLCCNLLSNSITNETEESVTLLDFMQKYYETSVDPLAMQQVEKSRNLVKYLNDVLSRIVPIRCVAGKGRGWKYPELAAAAIKFSLVSTDAIAHVLIPDSQMDRLNDMFFCFWSIGGGSAHTRS